MIAEKWMIFIEFATSDTRLPHGVHGTHELVTLHDMRYLSYFTREGGVERQVHSFVSRLINV